LLTSDGGAGASGPRLFRFVYATEPTGFVELRVPFGSGPFPVVILIHGGFWHTPYGLDLMDGLGDVLARRGIASWNIEYRRVGEPGGGWPGTLIDAARATDRLADLGRTHRLDLARVITVGHSAGGHLALWLAARRKLPVGALGLEEPVGRLTGPAALPLVGAISLAGVVDLADGYRRHLGLGAVADLLGGSPDRVPDRYAVADPARHLPLGLPQTLIHGTLDTLVPPEMSRDYTAAALAVGDPVRLRILSGSDHFDVIDPASSAWAAIVEEIAAMLTAP
jgi:acetyl esterase/lipase